MSIHVLIMFAPKLFFRSLGSTLGFISTGLFAGYYLGTTTTLQNSQKQPQAETALQSSNLSENAPSPPASLPPTSSPSIQAMKKVIFSKKEKSSPFLPSVFSPESHTYGRFLNAAEEADSTLEKKEPFSSWETEQNQKILEKAKSDPEYAKLLVDGILSDPHLSNLEKKKMLAELERRGVSPLSAKIEPNPEASPTPTPPVSGDKQNPEKHTLAMWYGSCDKVSETQFE